MGGAEGSDGERKRLGVSDSGNGAVVAHMNIAATGGQASAAEKHGYEFRKGPPRGCSTRESIERRLGDAN
jgi:hypothetical protein